MQGILGPHSTAAKKAQHRTRRLLSFEQLHQLQTVGVNKPFKGILHPATSNGSMAAGLPVRLQSGTSSKKRSRENFFYSTVSSPAASSMSAEEEPLAERDLSPFIKRRCREVGEVVMDAVCIPAAVANGRFPNVGKLGPLYAAAADLLGPDEDDVSNALAQKAASKTGKVPAKGSSPRKCSAPSKTRVTVTIFSKVSDTASETKDDSAVRQKVFGDGRCAFRALGRAAFPDLLNKCQRDSRGLALDEDVRADERQIADLLRVQVAEAFRAHSEEMGALVESLDLDSYVEDLMKVSTWAGELELYLAAKHVLDRVVEVWVLPEGKEEVLREGEKEGVIQAKKKGWGGAGDQPKCIQRYETEGAGQKLEPLRLLYNGKDHWDLYVGPCKPRCGLKTCNRKLLPRSFLQASRVCGGSVDRADCLPGQRAASLLLSGG